MECLSSCDLDLFDFLLCLGDVEHLGSCNFDLFDLLILCLGVAVRKLGV